MGCEHVDSAGIWVIPLERYKWRLLPSSSPPPAAMSACPTHRYCLRKAKQLPATAEQCEWLIEPMTQWMCSSNHRLIFETN